MSVTMDKTHTSLGRLPKPRQGFISTQVPLNRRMARQPCARAREFYLLYQWQARARGGLPRRSPLQERPRRLEETMLFRAATVRRARLQAIGCRMTAYLFGRASLLLWQPPAQSNQPKHI